MKDVNFYGNDDITETTKEIATPVPTPITKQPLITTTLSPTSTPSPTSTSTTTPSPTTTASPTPTQSK